jgi:perosamine synthetase
MKIPLMRPELSDEMIDSAVCALKNENFLKGKSVEEFETNFAKYVGVKYAIAVNSGTSALHLSLMAMDVRKGDSVVTTPATFIATANPIIYLSAQPKFVDVSLNTYTINNKELEKLIKEKKEKLKAIIPVHLYGYPCRMDEILEMSERYGIGVLEDACQAHGAEYKNRKVGSFGRAAAFSFYPSKNMTVCGDGGMITTDDYELAEKVKSLRDVGRRKNETYIHDFVGFTSRMNTVNAAIGNVQLKRLEKWNDLRRRASKIYRERLDGVGDIVLPPAESHGIKPVWYLFVVRTRYRDLLKKHLESLGIQCGIHYPVPVHLQPPYKQLGYAEGMYPTAERWAKEVISLPMYPSLSEKEIEYVVTSTEEFYERRDPIGR